MMMLILLFFGAFLGIAMMAGVGKICDLLHFKKVCGDRCPLCSVFYLLGICMLGLYFVYVFPEILKLAK